MSDSGLVHNWLNRANVPINISKSVKLKLTEIHSLSWKTEVFDSPKCLNYRIFKQDFGFENYFNVLPDDLSKAFCHFRSLNHKMPIEWGRYLGTRRDARICELCRLHKIGDELHYMLECTFIDDTLQQDPVLSHDIYQAFQGYSNHYLSDLILIKLILKTFQVILRKI